MTNAGLADPSGGAAPVSGGDIAAMPRDLRGSPVHAEVEAFYRAHFRPGSDHVHAASDLQATCGALFFQGLSFPETLETGPRPRVCRLDRATGTVSLVRRDARLPRPSADGGRLALVDGNDLLVLDAASFDVLHACTIEGRIEQLAWSPDGARLGLLVAGRRADVSGAEGGYALGASEEVSGWLPEVDSGESADLWRTILIWHPGVGAPATVTAPPLNVWEFAWLGDLSIVAVASDHHGEASWYAASLRRVDLATGDVRVLHRPRDQIGGPVASPDGCRVAFIETVCSDRGIMCGVLRLWDGDGVAILATRDTDVSSVRWLSSTRLAYAGLRGSETVIGQVDLASGVAEDRWASLDLTCGEWHPSLCVEGEDVFVHVEAYAHAPALARVRPGGLDILHDFAAPGASVSPGRIELVRWTAPDGLEIEGWLIRGEGEGPAPLLVDIHGGPIWAHRNRWAARMRSVPLLVARGWAVLLPNMRGAPGRGTEFARRVVGDMGGADSADIVAGIEHLVASGVVDRTRVAVTGTSYGGFMSAWLVTQHSWLAAAVPISPVSNWYSQHHTSQIASFDDMFLQGSAHAPGGQYFERSPALRAGGATTPTLILAGALDKNTPPTQALEFHHALLEAGCRSVLCTYPQGGHSLRGYPAYLDSAARVIAWLETV
jgi:dipeptidyl aminopeptidase/acylaminoacyl peptidase